MAQNRGWHPYPIVEWELVDGVSFEGMPVFRHPFNGEIGYDNGQCLLGLPANVEAAIRTGTQGRLA